MVQSASRLWLRDARGGYPRYFRAHGNSTPLRDDGIAPRPVRAGALRPGPQGPDGRGGAAGERPARSGIALAPPRQRAGKALDRILRIATAVLVGCWAFAAPPARAAGQDTIEIVTKT